MGALPENLVLQVVSEIHDPVTTTDELIPSGETSSYRSNPLGLAEYTIVRKYISLEDFTEELYRKVAEKMFAELDNGQFQPAGIISMFEDEEEQRQAAELFHTTLPELSTKQERERAFHDILVSVKRNSYQYYMAQLGTDVNAVKKAVEGKKALEELQRARISLE